MMVVISSRIGLGARDSKMGVFRRFVCGNDPGGGRVSVMSQQFDIVVEQNTWEIRIR